MRTVLRVLGTLLLLALLLAGGIAYYAYTQTRPAGEAAYTLEVRPGDTLPEVARRLQARGVVKSAQALRLIMRSRGTAGSLKEGLYDLKGNLSAFEVADELAGTPRPRVREVTIPEGKRLKDLPAIFKKAQLGQPDQLGQLLQDPKLSPYAKHSLEGFLFPATYPFRPEATNRDIVAGLVRRMNQELSPANIAKARALGLSPYGWVTLASMVQAEAGNSQEMPVIAGIFLNRLDDGIALGSDPTVAYGLGKDLPQLDRSAGDFKKDTPYNTYTRAGLPKGPINNPGQAALEAVLNPVREVNGKPALYFLHGRGGEFRVNATYAAHLRDIARYR